MSLDQSRGGMPKLAAPSTQFYTSEEAMQFGVELDAGWKLKVVPPVNGGQPSISYLTPEDWELTQDHMWVSPTGQRFTDEQMEAQEAGEVSDVDLLYQEYQRTGGELSPEDWQSIGAPLRPFTEQVFGKLFPDGDIQQLLNSMVTEGMSEPEARKAETVQDDLLRDLWDIGRNKDTEALLRQLGASEAQIEELFAPVLTEAVQEDRRFLGPTAMEAFPKPEEGISMAEIGRASCRERV